MTATLPSRHAPPKMAERLREVWATDRSWWGRITTVDHKIIGKRYLVTALVFLVVGGLEAALMRIQLATPNQRVLSPDAYNQLFSMHGITMIFWYAAPILSGFSNFLFPLMLGSRDMAFPRLNAFSYWTFLFSGILLYVSVPLAQMPDVGWFGYVPLAGPTFTPDLGADFYALGLLFLTVSTTVGAINFVVSAARMRAPGMSIRRLPLYIWGTLTSSVASLLALPALTVACVFLYLDRHAGTQFFDPAGGGSPLLWQHLFWAFGHPWVYIIVLPAISIVSTILPTFARRRIIGYGVLVFATVATAAFGFIVWVHHMFAAGVSQTAMTLFSAASFAIAVPSGLSVFAWIATLWSGRLSFETPMLFVLGFLVLFVIGGVSGVMTASVAFDWQLTDSYFVVAHLHYVLIGINLFPVIAALYYWMPKLTGWHLDERIGKWNFWVMFVGMNVAFFPMHLSGMLGMARRVYTYPDAPGLEALNLLSSAGAAIFAAGIGLVAWNVWWSARHGRRAGDNPWNASTLEWATSSPPPPYNFAALPKVQSRDPLWDDAEPARDDDDVAWLDDGHQAVTTSPAEGRAMGVLHMPGPSPWPFAVAVAILVVFAALLANVWWLAAAAVLAVGIGSVAWLWPPAEEEHG